MKINELRSPRGYRKKIKRVGRGESSGHGKTSGRGSKGMLARSGPTLRAGFEGGQMSLMRRVPKRGFNSRTGKKYQIINVESLNIFKDGDTVGIDKLRENKIIRQDLPVKVLGSGDLKKRIDVEAHKFSGSAVEKIKKAGGNTKILS